MQCAAASPVLREVELEVEVQDLADRPGQGPLGGDELCPMGLLEDVLERDVEPDQRHRPGRVHHLGCGLRIVPHVGLTDR